MKKEISPVVIAASVVVALLVVGGLWYALSGRETGLYTESGAASSGGAPGRGGRASARGGGGRASERAEAK